MVSPSILLITSCTGEKSVEDENELTLEDFRRGAKHVRERERKLEAKLTPAEELYTGMQHTRLMRGVQAARAAGLAADLKIVSAGYGLVDGSRKLAPYEATFIGMGKRALRAWAEQLGIAKAVRAALAGRHDLILVLLGDDYLGACSLDATLELGGPTIVLCGKASGSRLPGLADLKPVLLTSTDAKQFSCGLVGLKGEVAARILESLAADPNRLLPTLKDGHLHKLEDHLELLPPDEKPLVNLWRDPASVNFPTRRLLSTLRFPRETDARTLWRLLRTAVMLHEHATGRHLDELTLSYGGYEGDTEGRLKPTVIWLLSSLAQICTGSKCYKLDFLSVKAHVLMRDLIVGGSLGRLLDIQGIGLKSIQKLVAAGIRGFHELANVQPGALVSMGLRREQADAISRTVNRASR